MDQFFEQFDKSLSCSFQDIGRESLGILHPEHFGRASNQLLDLSDSFNNNSFFQKSILSSEDYGRESLIDGRESLGILELTKLNIKFGDETVRETILPTVEENESGPSVLDTAFLDVNTAVLGAPVGSQLSANTHHFSSVPEETSKIYVLPKNQSISNSTKTSRLSLINSSHSTSLLSWETLQRSNSPGMEYNEVHSRYSRKSGETNCFKEVEDDLSPNKIFNGSTMDDSVADLLDSITEPNWPQDLDLSNEMETPIVETENVFKAIDKTIPINLQIKTIDAQCKTSNSKLGGHSKDAKAILQNLSNIINDTERDDLRKSKGQSLINTLVDMFCDESSDSISNIDASDSGIRGTTSVTTSNEIKADNHQHDDLTRKMTKSAVVSKKPNCINKKINFSVEDNFKTNQPSVPSSFKASHIGHGIMSSVIDSKSDMKTVLPNSKAKFRSKSPVLKPKGPLKAVIPLKDMKRISLNTPQKSNQGISSNRPSRRSTPILEQARTSSPTRAAIIGISPLINKNKDQSKASSSAQKHLTPTVLVRKKIASPRFSKDIDSNLNSLSSNPSRIESPGSIPRSAHPPYRRGSVSQSRRNSNSDNNDRDVPSILKRSHSLDNGLNILTDKNRIGQNSKRVISPLNSRKTSKNNNNVGTGSTVKIKSAIMSTRRGGKENLKP